MEGMQPRELLILLMAGLTLVAVGLFPSLLDGFQNGVENFSALLSGPLARKLYRIERERHPVRFWLAAIGLGFIVTALLAIAR